jgi:hypothetical protein
LATDYPESAQDNQGKYSGEATLADLKNVDCSSGIRQALPLFWTYLQKQNTLPM